MKFRDKLIWGEIKANYKNVILDVALENGELVPAFCYESNSSNLLYPIGMEVWLSLDKNEHRKVCYEVQLVKNQGGLVFVNPSYLQELFLEALKLQALEDFEGYEKIRQITPNDGLKYTQFELTEKDGASVYLYVGYIYRKEGGYVVFPSNMDLVEMKVLDEFRNLREKGHKTTLVFLALRSDVRQAKFSWVIDQMAAAKIFDEAKNGLKFVCYGCKVDENEVEVANKLEIVY